MRTLSLGHNDEHYDQKRKIFSTLEISIDQASKTAPISLFFGCNSRILLTWEKQKFVQQNRFVYGIAIMQQSFVQERKKSEPPQNPFFRIVVHHWPSLWLIIIAMFSILLLYNRMIFSLFRFDIWRSSLVSICLSNLLLTSGDLALVAGDVCKVNDENDWKLCTAWY